MGRLRTAYGGSAGRSHAVYRTGAGWGLGWARRTGRAWAVWGEWGGVGRWAGLERGCRPGAGGKARGVGTARGVGWLGPGQKRPSWQRASQSDAAVKSASDVPTRSGETSAGVTPARG